MYKINNLSNNFKHALFGTESCFETKPKFMLPGLRIQSSPESLQFAIHFFPVLLFAHLIFHRNISRVGRDCLVKTGARRSWQEIKGSQVIFLPKVPCKIWPKPKFPCAQCTLGVGDWRAWSAERGAPSVVISSNVFDPLRLIAEYNHWKRDGRWCLVFHNFHHQKSYFFIKIRCDSSQSILVQVKLKTKLKNPRFCPQLL